MPDHSRLRAWALCWPTDPAPLLYTSADRAEEDRAWFAKNFKNDRHGNPRGEPFVLELEAKSVQAKQATEAPTALSIDDAMTKLATARTARERMLACEALAAAADREAKRLRGAIAKAAAQPSHKD